MKNKFFFILLLSMVAYMISIPFESFAYAANVSTNKEIKRQHEFLTDISKISKTMENQQSVKKMGAMGDGVTDDTVAIQRALDKGGIITFPKGVYMIDAASSKGLKVKSNSNLKFASGAILKCIPNGYTSYNIILIKNANNVTITNATIVGDRNDHKGISGEWGMGIAVINSNNILIDNTRISDCWGDGVYLGTASNLSENDNQNIVLKEIICKNNRRDGLSIVNGKNIKVLNSQFIDTKGTAPQFGIEPNIDLLPVIGVIIKSCYFSNNIGGGILAINGQKIIISNSTFEDKHYAIFMRYNVKDVQIMKNFIDEGGIIRTFGYDISLIDNYLIKLKS